jgi:hypothetical protein
MKRSPLTADPQNRTMVSGSPDYSHPAKPAHNSIFDHLECRSITGDEHKNSRQRNPNRDHCPTCQQNPVHHHSSSLLQHPNRGLPRPCRHPTASRALVPDDPETKISKNRGRKRDIIALFRSLQIPASHFAAASRKCVRADRQSYQNVSGKRDLFVSTCGCLRLPRIRRARRPCIQRAQRQYPRCEGMAA